MAIAPFAIILASMWFIIVIFADIVLRNDYEIKLLLS